jgi:hypothetical protein
MKKAGNMTVIQNTARHKEYGDTSNPSINTDASDKAAGAGYVKR